MGILSTKISAHLRRLAGHYQDTGELLLFEIIGSGSYFFRESTHYDNWNGGTDGHTVVLFSSLDTLRKIPPTKQKSIQETICNDLHSLSSIEDEHYAAVALEVSDENDPEYIGSTPCFARPTVDPERIEIWELGLARVFISHRDKYKSQTRELADALQDYGMSCFVAHETIPADEEWQKIILGGLDTMEAMVAFITDDFHESYWTMQEVGFAVARGVPIIALKVEKQDPPGFIAHKQALKGRIDTQIKNAENLYPLIGSKLRKKERFDEILINSFCKSQDFNQTKHRFERMKNTIKAITYEQGTQISIAFQKNDQLHRAGHLVSKYNRLTKFLNSTTDGDWWVENQMLVNRNANAQPLDEEPPF